MIIMDNNKSVLKTSGGITYLLKFCWHNHAAHGFLISHKAQQNYQSESKFNSAAVIMKGQISPSIDFSASSSLPSSTSVWLSCFHILIIYWIIDQPHAALQLQSTHTHTHTPSYFCCCGDFRCCRCVLSFDLKMSKAVVVGILGGTLFHDLGAATERAWSSNLLYGDLGTSNRGWPEEHSSSVVADFWEFG